MDRFFSKTSREQFIVDFVQKLKFIEGPITADILIPQTSQFPLLILLGDDHFSESRCATCLEKNCGSFYENTFLVKVNNLLEKHDMKANFFFEMWHDTRIERPYPFKSALLNIIFKPVYFENQKNITPVFGDPRSSQSLPFDESAKTLENKAEFFAGSILHDLYTNNNLPPFNIWKQNIEKIYPGWAFSSLVIELKDSCLVARGWEHFSKSLFNKNFSVCLAKFNKLSESKKKIINEKVILKYGDYEYLTTQEKNIFLHEIIENLLNEEYPTINPDNIICAAKIIDHLALRSYITDVYTISKILEHKNNFNIVNILYYGAAHTENIKIFLNDFYEEPIRYARESEKCLIFTGKHTLIEHLIVYSPKLIINDNINANWLNDKFASGVTFFEVALKNKHIQNAGLDVYIIEKNTKDALLKWQSIHGRSVYSCAIRYNSNFALKMLIDKFGCPKQKGLFFLASACNNLGAAQLLINAGYSPNDNYRNIPAITLCKNDPEWTDFLNNLTCSKTTLFFS